ncbi:MAG: hypothetical protein EOO29_22960 [Comamonadaceae bacterium]|nr:MAG: hypothetical protein EOO29_22960 [Comamonadaceae bacterium]
MNPKIIGLEKPLEDPKTGVTLSFHVLHQYQVNVNVHRTLASLSSFASHAAYVSGKSPVSATTVGGLVGEPTGDAAQWCYQALIDTADEKNVLAGAVPVHAAADPAAEVPEQ